MGDPSTSDTATPEIQDWHSEALDALASFLKASFLYPANNERVLSCSDRLLQAVQQMQQDIGAEVKIRIFNKDFRVADKLVSGDKPLVEWLREALIKTALGGLALSADAHRESLAEFAEVLRRNFTNSSRGFESMWQESFDGVQLFELRFAGRHEGEEGGDDEAVLGTGGDKGADDRILEMLLHNEEVMQKLESLKADIAAMVDTETERVTAIDLLHPIRDALPAEALLDPGNACLLVEQVLNSSGKRIQDLIRTGQTGEQDALEMLATEVGRQFFQRSTHELEDIDIGKLPEGRPEDDDVVDDLEAMLAELAELPKVENLRLVADPHRDQREVIGVCLHLLATTDQDPILELIRAQLGRLLDEHPEHRDLAVPYLDACLNPDAEATGLPKHIWRVLSLVLERGYEELTRDRNILAPKVVEASFPHLLPQFLDSLRMEDKRDRTKVQELLAAVGIERIAATAPTLVDSGALSSPRRVKTLLRSGAEGLSQIALRLAKVREPEVRHELVEYLRHLDLPAAETTALRVVRPATELTPAYLTDLLLLQADPERRRAVMDESGRLTRHFLRKSSGDERMLDARIRATHQLRSLTSKENLQMLNELRREGGLLIMSKKQRELQKAAKTAYKFMLTRMQGGARL